MFSEKFNRLNNEDVRISFYNINKLCEFIKVHKNPLSFLRRNLMWCTRSVAKIGVSYVRLYRKTRIAEHRNHIRWNTTTHSVITDHRLEENHEFDLENVAIFDEEPQYRKRLVSEMLHIRRQDTWPQPADGLGGAFQGLLSSSRRTINIGALLLPVNLYILRYMKIKLLNIQFWFWCPSGL